MLKYDGWFVTKAEAEAKKTEWSDFGVVTKSRSTRMADVQFISELMAILIRKKLSGFDQEALDEIYADYDDLTDLEMFDEDDFRQRFEKLKTYIRDVLAIDPALVVFLKIQGHFYTLWGYLCLEFDRLLVANEFTEIYGNFLQCCPTIKNARAFFQTGMRIIRTRIILKQSLNIQKMLAALAPILHPD